MNNIDIHIDDTLRAKLNAYCDFLLSENAKYNLTAITEKAEVWQKHFVDSMLGSVAIPFGSTVCDVGCGAGFPSVPLKLLREDIQITCKARGVLQVTVRHSKNYRAIFS